MFCPNCGKEQAESAKFCVACGQKLPIIENDEDNKEEDSSGNEFGFDPSFEGNTTSAPAQSGASIQTPAQVPTQTAAPSQAPVQVPTPAPAPAQTTSPYPTPYHAPVQPVSPYPAPAPAPVRVATPYPSPAPVASTIAGAASKASSGVKWVVVLSVIAAIAVLLFALFYKTDEQKIEDRLEAFSTACNSGDLQGMFDCFDKHTRQMYSTTIGLTEGIIGGLTGFDLPLGDLFNLFAMESIGSEGMGLEFEIVSIEIDGNTATVTLTDTSANELGDDTIVMCKEGDDWYIDYEGTTGQSLSMFGDAMY